MTRPRTKTVEYFPHSTGASESKTLFILENKYGVAGYAFWFKLLELLGKSEGHCIATSSEADWEFIGAKTKVSGEVAKEILDMLAKLDAIDADLWNNNGLIWSNNFVRGLEAVYAKRSTEKPTRPTPISKISKTVSGEKTPVSGEKTPVSGEKTPVSGENIPLENDFRSRNPTKEVEERRGEEVEEKEKESEKKPKKLFSPESGRELEKQELKPCPHMEIINLYHKILPAHPRVLTWEDDRQIPLRARWREDTARQNLDWWKAFFETVQKSDFLSGRTESKDKGPFMPNLDWMIKLKNFRKILEGNFTTRKNGNTTKGVYQQL